MLPQVSGTLSFAGLDGKIEIHHDSYGIPHIYATTPHDLFFAQGTLRGISHPCV
jgi:penicillin G amidase